MFEYSKITDKHISYTDDGRNITFSLEYDTVLSDLSLNNELKRIYGIYDTAFSFETFTHSGVTATYVSCDKINDVVDINIQLTGLITEMYMEELKTKYDFNSVERNIVNYIDEKIIIEE